MIVQVGPYPPPLGGISAYIKRMKRYLDSRKIDNEVWNISGKKDISKKTSISNINFKYVPLYYLVSRDIDIIHYNISGKKAKYFIGVFNKILFRNRKKIITIHGESTDLFNKNNYFMTKSLNSFDAVICVKKGDRQFLKNMGIKCHIYEIPAYINPKEDEIDNKSIPQEVWGFIDKSKFLISANGCIRFNNGQDLYGIDILINLVYKLNSYDIDVNLLIALLGVEGQSNKEKRYYNELKNRISELNLEDKIFIFEVKDTEFYPILQKSNLFIRPTNTDGDAVSVREALYYKIPTIASDVVARPEGTVLFQTRNQKDLVKEVMDVIKNYNHYKKIAGKITIKDYANDVLDVYESLLRGEKLC